MCVKTNNMIYKTRKRLYKNEAKILGFKVKQNQKGRKQSRYSVTKEQWNVVLNLRDERRFVTTQEKLDKNGNVTSSVSKLQEAPIEPPDNFELIKVSTSSGTGQQWLQYKPKTDDVKDVLDLDFIEGIVKKHIKPIKNKTKIKELDYFDRLIYTDCHIGMTPNESGNSLYGGKWDEEELMNRLDIIIENIESSQKGNFLVIDELGDLVDGWNGETVRRGHKLPQNMNNREMFDTAVTFKIKMIDLLVDKYQRILVNNICNDNHAGDFGYVVNSAFKYIIEQKYKNVKVSNYSKFINHYYVGKHAFVISHGKDSHALKFGFKPHLDPKQIEKIDQYLKVNNVYKNAEFIEFSKGDSHQMLFDSCGSDDFHYYNYPALSPSSEWVQTNFKRGRSGFVLQNVSYKEDKKIINPIFF